MKNKPRYKGVGRNLYGCGKDIAKVPYPYGINFTSRFMGEAPKNGLGFEYLILHFDRQADVDHVSVR